MRRWIRASVVAIVVGTPALAAGPVRTTIDSLGNNEFHMQFLVDVNASSAAVWQALTDYDHQRQRLPYLSRSQVVYRNWDYAIVDQEGRIQYWFWTFTVWVQQKVVEKPMSEVDFRAVDGDFSVLEGSWTLQGSAQGPIRLACELVMQPRRHVPGWAVRWSARKYLGAMVEALAKNAEERGARGEERRTKNAGGAP